VFAPFLRRNMLVRSDWSSLFGSTDAEKVNNRETDDCECYTSVSLPAFGGYPPASCRRPNLRNNIVEKGVREE